MNAEGGEKWVDALKKWEDGDRKGHVPRYYLRPEVSLSSHLYMKVG
jgi:hypothetical protein